MFNIWIPKYKSAEPIEQEFIESLCQHISYVVEAGEQIGVNPDQLEIHDNSKWSDNEFYAYAKHFCGGGAPDEFSKAWIHHIHLNPHHWQHWIYPDGFTPKGSDVEKGVVEMPSNYALEMIADWMGASKVYTGSWDMAEWLQNNMSRIKVHSKTAVYLREILDHLGYADIIYTNNFSQELSE